MQTKSVVKNRNILILVIFSLLCLCCSTSPSENNANKKSNINFSETSNKSIQDNLVAPSEFLSTPTTEITQTPKPTPTKKILPTSTFKPTQIPVAINQCQYSCVSPDRDCADFSSHTQAQTFFNCCGFTAQNDPMQLDGRWNSVDDGIACESI